MSYPDRGEPDWGTAYKTSLSVTPRLTFQQRKTFSLLASTQYQTNSIYLHSPTIPSMFSAAALIALLPLFTSAFPYEPRALNSTPAKPGPFYLRVASPGSRIDQELVSASEGGFWIGKPTEAVPCPASAGCGFPTNVTIINLDTTTGTASLDSDPHTGGQAIYVGADYQLHFNPPHYNHDPSSTAGNTYTGFGYQPAVFANNQPGYSFTFSAPGEEGWFACPGGSAGGLKLYATEGAQCYFFKLEAIPFNQQPGQYGAWEYL